MVCTSPDTEEIEKKNRRNRENCPKCKICVCTSVSPWPAHWAVGKESGKRALLLSQLSQGRSKPAARTQGFPKVPWDDQGAQKFQKRDWEQQTTCVPRTQGLSLHSLSPHGLGFCKVFHQLSWSRVHKWNKNIMFCAAEASHSSFLILKKGYFLWNTQPCWRLANRWYRGGQITFTSRGHSQSHALHLICLLLPTGNYGNLVHGSKEKQGQGCWGSLTAPSLQDTAPRQCHMVLALLVFCKSQLLESCDLLLQHSYGFFFNFF